MASVDNNERVNAVVNILKEIEINDNQKECVAYVMKRLMKGIGSSRKKARLGFSTALVHVIKACSKYISLKEVHQMIDEHQVLTGSATGNEEREAHFGKAFALIAILQNLKQDSSNEEDVALANLVYGDLLSLMNRKNYLKELVVAALCHSLQNMSVEDFQPLKELFLEKVAHGWKTTSAGDVMIARQLFCFEDEDLQEKLVEKWGSKDILASKNLKHATQVLMDTTEISHPKIHGVWEPFLEKAKKKGSYLKSFWNIIVEETLLKSTHERKFLAIQLLLRLLSSVSADMVEVLFSPDMVRCILNSCSSKENFLYKAAKDMLGKLPDELALNPDKDVISNVLKSLVGSNGNVMFDTITNTKTVESLSLKLTDLDEHFNWLKSIFSKISTEVNGKDDTAIKIWVVNQVTVLAKAARKKENEALVLNTAMFLFLHGHFRVLKKNKKEILLAEGDCNVTEKVNQLAQQRFQTVLSELTCWSRGIPGQAKKSTIGVSSDGELFTKKILQFAESLLQKPKYVVLLEEWLPETREAFEEEAAQLQEQTPSEEGGVGGSQGMMLLRHHAALHLFNEQTEAISVIKDVQECCRKADKKQSNKKGPEWIEVLLEILINFLAQPSNVMRHVVEQVFRSICPHLTPEAFKLITQVLEAKKTTDLQDEDDEESSDEDEEEGDKKTDDEEEGKEKVEADESDESSDSEDEEEEEEEGEVDEELQKKIRKALGDAAVKGKSTESDSDEDDEDEEDSEEEMEDLDMDASDPATLNALDEALANIFREKKKKVLAKKDKVANLEAMYHFKLRVLDLITIFIKEQPTDPKIISLVKPMLSSIQASQNKKELSVIRNKTISIFKSKLCQSKEHPKKDIDSDEVHKTMTDILEMAKQSNSSANFVELVSQGLIYLVKVLRGNVDTKGPSPLKTRSQRKRKVDTSTKKATTTITRMSSSDEAKVVELYEDALDHFMTKKKSVLQIKIFQEFINRFPNIAWKLAPSLSKHLNSACNNFRKAKCTELLRALFSHRIEEEEEYVQTIAEELLKSLKKMFKSTKDEDFSLKPRQLCEVVRLIDGFKKLKQDHPEVKLSWKKLATSLESMLTCASAADCKPLVQIINSRLKMVKGF